MMSEAEPLLVNLTDPPSVTVRTRKMPRICGEKLSSCCFVMSIWGVLMLVLMGVFYHIQAVALIEDIPQIHNNTNWDKGYQQASYNCFVAAGIYFVTFLFSGYQMYAISRGYTRL